MNSTPTRTPWGFWHIVVILLLTLVCWVGIGIAVGLTLLRRGQQPTLSIGSALYLTAVLYMLLYLVILFVVRSSGGWHRLGYVFPGWPAMLKVVAFIPIWYAIIALMGYALAYLINQGKTLPSNVTDLFGPGGVIGVGPGVIALTLVVVAVVVPLVEEALFRGVIYQWLRGRVGVTPAVLLDGMIFAGAHLASGAAVIVKLLPLLFVMGCMLAITFQRTRSLFASMLLHGANNSIAVVVLVLLSQHPA